MALMRTGRKGEDPTKKKGVEPTKAQSEVKVTAKKPGEPRRPSTWEDVAKAEEIKSRNAAKKAQYESDVAGYNKAMKLYNEGDVPTASAEELSVMNKANANVKGKKATFSENKESWSAARENADYEKLIKSGKYVDIDDPRIDAKTKYFLKGATMKMGSGSDVLGERTGKIAVPIEKALGKEKPTKWGDVYGGKDFNPYEFEKASKSGKLEKYMEGKGMRPGDLAVSEVGARTQYKTPKKPVEQAYEKEMSIDRSSLSIPKVRTLKKDETFKGIGTAKNVGEVIKKTGKLSIPEKKEKEAATFEEPTGGVRMKTRTVKAKNQSLGDYIGGNIKYAVNKATGGTPVLRGGVKKQREALFQGKTGKQAKEFKAYYGAPASISGSERSNMTASDIAQERESLKGVKKELRADIKKGGVVSKPELRAELRNVRKDIRATKKAEKYAEKNIEARSVYPGGKEEVILVEKPNAGSNPYRGSELGSKYSEFSKDQKIRKSTDNPSNRNTTFGRKIKKEQ
jgi:hypothetical protein